MSKKDVRVETLLAWDQYEGKPVAEALPAIYSHAQESAKVKCTWYWDSIKTKRRASLGVRFVAFTFLIFGTLLPLLAGLGDKSEVRLLYTQIGVAALAFAGLMQVADRVFGWSSGWLRYMTTATAMENLTRKFELDWASYTLEKGGSLGNQDIKPLFDLAKGLEDGLSKMQSDETDKWVADFNSGMALLGELIKSQREAGEKAVEVAHAAQAKAAEEREKARQTGSVELTLVHQAVPVAIKIALDDETAQEFVGSSWARSGLTPGQHIISVMTTSPPSQTIQKIVEVPPAGVARAEINLR